MKSLARRGALTAGLRPDRLPWRVAAGRSIRTTRVVASCRREIAREAAHVPGPLPRDRALWLHEASQRISAAMGVELRLRGSIPHGPAVLVANHLSYLDPIAIAHALPVGAVAKSEVSGWPALGRTFDQLGILFVRRQDTQSGAVVLRKAIRRLDQGVPVLVFPEGTTTVGRDVLPFFRGAFGAAMLADVPVVPVTLRYGQRDICWVGSARFVPHFVSLHRHAHLTAWVDFGAPISPRGFEDPESFAEAARQHIRGVLLR